MGITLVPAGSPAARSAFVTTSSVPVIDTRNVLAVGDEEGLRIIARLGAALKSDGCRGSCRRKHYEVSSLHKEKRRQVAALQNQRWQTEQSVKELTRVFVFGTVTSRSGVCKWHFRHQPIV